ncbi:alpha/beta hydrolase [Pontiellaceae bacterium B12227]|nr:alpha/beta hydrolase [Pontiellaceae bacterium B12227]
MLDIQRFFRPAGLLIIFLAGCSSPPVDQIDLMPAPDVYGDGLLNLLPDAQQYQAMSHNGILFATDRKPSGKEDKEQYYLSDPGYAVRVGLAQVQFGQKDFTWEMARDVSLLKSRAESFPVKISNVDEWGIIQNTLPFWLDTALVSEELRPQDATREFADAINRQLAGSKKKHVYIYVHGYKVAFENPLLVSMELWHFLGYNGAFIAYSWPSTPSKFAYIKDSDTAVGFARNLRLLLEFVAEETNAEEVHIIGYSNGTRLVLRALEQLALMNAGNSPEEAQKNVQVGNVILVGSDLDRNTFGAYLADGLLDVLQHMTIYVSSADKALSAARFLTRRERLGELWGTGGKEMEAAGRKAFSDLQQKLSFVSVCKAEGSTEGKGHGYFRSSPWVSSDVLMMLYYDLTPKQRGLVMQEDMPIYSFPTDYIARLWSAIEKEDPVFAQKYQRMKKNSE